MIRPIKPMLARDRAADPDLDDGWILEIKYDGFRCILRTDIDDKVRLFTRRGNENSDSFPEITSLKVRNGMIIDGELVAWSPENGDSKLAYMQARNNVTNPQKLLLLQERFPVSFIAFDILLYDDVDCTRHQLINRKSILENMGMENPELSIIDFYEATEYKRIWKVVKERRLEGLVAKLKNGKYVEGARSFGWRKMKW